MADLSQTIAAATGVLGASEPNVWAAYNWNAFNWGYTGDFALTITKGIASDTAPVDAQGKDVTHEIAESQSSDSTNIASFIKIIAEAFAAVTGDLTSETLQDAAGYYYVFPDRATNAEDRDTPTWTSATVGSTTWTSATASSTSWT